MRIYENAAFSPDIFGLFWKKKKAQEKKIPAIEKKKKTFNVKLTSRFFFLKYISHGVA